MHDETLTASAALFGGSANSSEYEALTDGQLLEKFVHRHDEAAFAALVRRHGPMVLGVCRRVLRHNHDAEDALQATFLVLAEKAQRLQRPELLANWLYGVAYRTALHARQRIVRCRKQEREAATMFVPGSDQEMASQELQRVLDDELARLPEKYRAPLVLCYLEGKTNEEAARLLGWPVGSMSYRLARGRELLRGRLQARLALLSLFLPSISLVECLQPATVSPLLATTTVHAAVIVAGAKIAAAAEIISAPVRELAEATLRSMAPSRWRWLFVVLVILLALFGGGAAAVSIASDSRGPTSSSCPCSKSAP
jgi:RNA polymerase sigma factor (sigma-70 family)